MPIVNDQYYFILLNNELRYYNIDIYLNNISGVRNMYELLFEEGIKYIEYNENTILYTNYLYINQYAL